MNTLEIILLGAALAMDAFAVSVTKGLECRARYKEVFIIGLFFGGFQALMPYIGWLLGSRFLVLIEAYDHWVAFLILAAIGGKSLYEAIKSNPDEEEAPVRNDANCSLSLNYSELLLLAVATSIDALAVGITFAVMPEINVYSSIAIIGIVTFIISCCGVGLGKYFGTKYRRKASIAGGLILLAIGSRILLDGLGLLM